MEELYIIYQHFATGKEIIAAAPHRELVECLFKTIDRAHPLELALLKYNKGNGMATEEPIAYTDKPGSDIIWYWQ